MFTEISRYFTAGKHEVALPEKTSGFCGNKRKCFSLGFLGLLSGALLFHCVCITAAFGGESPAGVAKRELYRQGTAFFHQAVATEKSNPAAARDLYEKAALRFERLVAEGNVKNGKLFYNIGNTYFLLDDIGRAILNYRRAELYSPNDPNLAKNLAYARSIRQDKLERNDKAEILRTLFFFHYDLGIETRLILFGAAYTAFWLFAGIRIFSKRPFTSWGLGATLLFILLFGTSLFVESHKSTYDKDGVILTPEVIGRRGDAETYQPSFAHPLHAGTEFTLREQRGAWWQVELPDGRSTWIPAKSGELVKEKQRK